MTDLTVALVIFVAPVIAGAVLAYILTALEKPSDAPPRREPTFSK